MRNKAFFETSSIYEVDPQDCSLVRRDGDIQSIGWRRDDHGLRFPLQVDGLKRRDLAVFGHTLDETGVQENGFIVVMSDPGVVASEEFLLDDPDYQTAELARKIATLHEWEVAQLGIDSLVRELLKRFPRTKGLTK